MFTTPVLLFILLGAVGIYLAMPGGRRGLSKLALLPLAAAGGILLASLTRLFPGEAPYGAFLVFAIIALGAAIRVITHRRPVYSALYFILVIVAVAGLLVLAQAEFLAAALVIIYAGAILVTYVFVIMLAQQSGPAVYDAQAREPLLGIIAGFVMLALLTSGLLGSTTPAAESVPAVAAQYGQALTLGVSLMTEYVIGLQIAGVLLLAAMVGAIAIAQRPALELEEEESD